MSLPVAQGLPLSPPHLALLAGGLSLGLAQAADYPQVGPDSLPADLTLHLCLLLPGVLHHLQAANLSPTKAHYANPSCGLEQASAPSSKLTPTASLFSLPVCP